MKIHMHAGMRVFMRATLDWLEKLSLAGALIAAAGLLWKHRALWPDARAYGLLFAVVMASVVVVIFAAALYADALSEGMPDGLRRVAAILAAWTLSVAIGYLVIIVAVSLVNADDAPVGASRAPCVAPAVPGRPTP